MTLAQIIVKNKGKCCDTCRNYDWYYDTCEKYNCEIDGRGMCSSYDPRTESEE